MELQLEMFIPDIKLIKRQDRSFVFDPCRMKYVLFTQEEMIRQLLLQYFIRELKIPKSLISVERSIEINNMIKRYDIMLHHAQSLDPLLMVEVKRSETNIDQKVADQINIYNMSIGAPYLLLSNGVQNILFHSENGSLTELKEWPEKLLFWMNRN